MRGTRSCRETPDGQVPRHTSGRRVRVVGPRPWPCEEGPRAASGRRAAGGGREWRAAASPARRGPTPGTAAPCAMDPFLVLLHSVSASLSNGELMELKFLCQGRVSKRKLERVQSGVDLFTVLLEQNELDAQHTELLRELLTSLRRQDLLRRLDDFEADAVSQAPPEEQGERATRPGLGGWGPGECSGDRGRRLAPGREAGPVCPAVASWWRGCRAPDLYQVGFPCALSKQP